MIRQLKWLAVVLTIFLTGCYPDIKGKVVDTATGKPIEGALVVVQWTKEYGFPEPVRHLYKIVETQTDKEGNFTISGVCAPFLMPPEMIIYKDGYVPWSNYSIFPSTNIVKDYEWKDKCTYSLKLFDTEYSLEELMYFMNGPIMSDGLNMVPRYAKIRSEINDKYWSERRKTYGK